MKTTPLVSPFVRQFSASFRFLEPRITAITRSMMLQAAIRPSWISRLPSSFSRSTRYFRSRISCWKRSHSARILGRLMTSGLPSQMASILTPKVSSSFVFLYRIFRILSMSASFLSSMKMLTPSPAVAFPISVISGSFFASTSSAVSDMNFPMPAPIMV